MTTTQEKLNQPVKPTIDLRLLKQQLDQNKEEDEFKEKLEKHGGMTGALAMLHYCFQECKEGGRRNGWDAFKELLEFMGYELGFYSFPLDYEGEGPDRKLWKRLRQVVDFSLMADYQDNLGALVSAEELSWKEAGQFLTPGNLAEMMVEMQCITAKHDGRVRPASILDPAVGFGVFLIKAMKRFPDGSLFCGIDIDRRAVRATMVQLEVNKRFNHRDVEYKVLVDDFLFPGRLAGTYVDDKGRIQKFRWHRESLSWPDWSKANRW